MKGLLFNVLEEVVASEHGDDAWDELLETAELDGAYTSLGSYPDEQMTQLIRAAGTLFGRPADEVLRHFGRRALPIFAKRFPALFEGRRSTRDILVALNSIIHPEVRKIYPGAEVPSFDFHTSTLGQLIMGYASSRRLCLFAEGLIEGCADLFEEHLSVQQSLCVRKGNAICLFVVSFDRTERIPLRSVPAAAKS